MNMQIVLKEVKNPALKEIVKDLDDIVDNVRNGRINYQQGNMEIVGRKHIIQSIALDWAFGKQRKLIE